MKRTRPEEKIARKKQAWVERTARALTIGPEEARQLLAIDRRQSIRLNTLKSNEKSVVEAVDWIGAPYDWMAACYHLLMPVTEIRDHPLVTSGQVFIQNAASWLPVAALDARPGEFILDLCAAPGGKTSHIAATTRNQAHITANDNSRARLAKLQNNMQRLGAQAEYTLFDATHVAAKLEGRQFDRILVDAPCSGEGLMNITHDKDFATWSVAHIKRLQQLQKRLLTQAWRLLKPGGTLVYSTCTMAPEENEAVVDYLLRTHTDAVIQPFSPPLPNKVAVVREWNSKTFNPAVTGCLRLRPSPDIEAFFVCRLQKLKDYKS